jgi:hypothetical protein
MIYFFFNRIEQRIRLLQSGGALQHTKSQWYHFRLLICPELFVTLNKAEEMLDIFERKVLRRIFGSTQAEKGWRLRYNAEIYDLYKDMKVTECIKFRRLQWAEHRIPQKALQQRFRCRREIGKPRKRWDE